MRYAALALLALSLSLPPNVEAQQEEYGDEIYRPEVGMAGKDVIWVPTPMPVVEFMLDMAKVRPDDYVIVLGSGDGRMAIRAAKRGARALGIEYHPDLVALSKRLAAKAGVSDRATFVRGDLFSFDFSKASVVMMYLLPSLVTRLRPQLQAMKPGTRIVSHAFAIEGWPPNRVEKPPMPGRPPIYLWRVGCPAIVDFTDAQGQKYSLDIAMFIQEKGSREAALREVRERLAGTAGSAQEELKNILQAVSCSE